MRDTISEEQRLVAKYIAEVLRDLGLKSVYALSKRTYETLGGDGVSKQALGKAANPKPGVELISLRSLIAINKIAPGVPLPPGLFSLPSDINGHHAVGFAEPDVILLEVQSGDCPLSPQSADQSIWQLKTRALELPPYSYRPGDYLLLDTGVAPRAGNAVCAQVYDRQGGAETVFRAYEPPYIVVSTQDETVSRTPLAVDGSRVVIMGTVIKSVRLS